MREHQDDFSRAGAGLAAIGLGDFTYANLFREETGISFPLLVDEKRIAYKAADLKSANILHLLRRDNAAARGRARSAGHQQHRLGQNPFQLGASFVFAPGNRDVHVYLSRTFGDNPSAEMLLRAVQELKPS
ncbi:MAG: AhpC/TSA family protein [Acidobacteriaceae bacterium]|nr:AhpC/TSA family protein [Acidobacteriaceae bacterium]MBV9499912.1 AhpC/TSA family protein [Acidobacteriaceae bacterium]